MFITFYYIFIIQISNLIMAPAMEQQWHHIILKHTHTHEHTHTCSSKQGLPHFIWVLAVLYSSVQALLDVPQQTRGHTSGCCVLIRRVSVSVGLCSAARQKPYIRIHHRATRRDTVFCSLHCLLEMPEKERHKQTNKQKPPNQSLSCLSPT